MSPNYFCLNNIFLEVILVILISQSAFNQFREPIYNITTNITLPFDGQCSGNGSFMFIVEFRLVEFKDLLLANRNSTTNNIDNCLSFLFCYESESSGEYVKPQFKIVNSNSNKIWNFCMENWLGFYIVFCLHEHETEVPQLTMDTSFSFIEEEKQEMSISMGYFHSTKSYFRIQFEPNNFRFFIKLMMMKEFINGTWFTFGIASEMFLRESLEEVPKPLYYVKIDEQLCEWIQINTEGNVHCSGF